MSEKLLDILKAPIRHITNATSMPERVVIHHLGKAGEAFLALPMATVLKQIYPDAVIEWVILDRYRAVLGNHPYIDEITEVDSSGAKSLKAVGDLITNYHKKEIPYVPVRKDNGVWHCNAYCNYIVKTEQGGQQHTQEIPFYKQFFQNLPFQNHVWQAPSWSARELDIKAANDFLAVCGVRDNEKVIVISPFVADKTIPLAESDVDWFFLADRVKALGMPVIYTGTEFDERLVPDGCIDGFAPKLSLGALFYIIQTRAHLVVSANSGIGFAALFLKSNLLMYDNRKTWREHTHNYANTALHSDGEFWPMFDASKMLEDMPDWESCGIQRRWKKDEAVDDISVFSATDEKGFECLTRSYYPNETTLFARRLLNVRGHKYIKLPAVQPSCRVSVLVSLYNAKEYVVNRFYNLLEQTEKDIEVIVIDACSPQGDGRCVVEAFGTDSRLKVIRLSSRVPLYMAWNIGLAFSTGKYITNANADDLLDPTALKQLADCLDEQSDVDLVAGSWYEVNGEYNRWPAPLGSDVSTNMVPGHFPMWRRTLHETLGLFDDTMKIVGDIEWWLRISQSGKKIAKSHYPVGAYLNHGDNLFHAKKERRLQEIALTGWPYYHKVLLAENRVAIFKESKIPGTPLSAHNDADDLALFRDKHLGKRCFIMGNGPSLNKMDLSKLDNEVVFGCNACFLLFDRITWRPMYYSCVDSRVLPDRALDIVKMHEENPSMTLFFPGKLHIHDGTGAIKDTKSWIPKDKNRYYFNHVNLKEDNLPWSAFSVDANNHVVMPHTVSITLMQIAFYMGFRVIYLIGCDTSYAVADTVKADGPNYGNYGKLLLTSTKDDDPNHFDPRYFGTGKQWHNPKPGEMIRHYGWTQQVVNACGGRIFNATVGGNLEVFPRVSFDSLFK